MTVLRFKEKKTRRVTFEKIKIPLYSFFTSPYLPPLLEVERTSIALNVDDIR